MHRTPIWKGEQDIFYWQRTDVDLPEKFLAPFFCCSWDRTRSRRQYSSGSDLEGRLVLGVGHKIDGRRVGLTTHTLAEDMLEGGDMAGYLPQGARSASQRAYSAGVDRLVETC
jgi:hypothetical protein